MTDLEVLPVDEDDDRARPVQRAAVGQKLDRSASLRAIRPMSFVIIAILVVAFVHLAISGSSPREWTACSAMSRRTVARLLGVAEVSAAPQMEGADADCRWDATGGRSALFVIERSDRLLTSNDPAERIARWSFRDGGVTAGRLSNHVTAVVRSNGVVVAADVNGLEVARAETVIATSRT